MKLFASLLSLGSASHFRAGSLQYASTPGGITITRYQGWRRFSDGYSGGCEQSDIDNHVLSSGTGNEYITKISDGTSMAQLSSNYYVTNMEISPSIDTSSHYCFGSIELALPATVTEPFTQYSSSCCTITLTFDDGYTTSGAFGYTASVYDLTNNSPSFESPPIWYIMTGCSDQSLNLNPTDADGDTIRCRWSTAGEAFMMAHNSNLQQFLLDEENCKITYRAEYDSVGIGAKPISIQVEDFDAAGNIRSSVPSQFVGVVFQPNMNLTDGARGSMLYAGILSEDDTDSDHAVVGNNHRTGRATEPDHCGGKPEFISPSPEEGDHIQVSTSSTVTIQWAAVYESNGQLSTDLDRAMFNAPSGMSCTALDAQGKASCHWATSSSDIGKHPLCAIVYDKFGRSSDRRCVTIEVNEVKVNVVWWLEHLNPGMDQTSLVDYGCCGRGPLNPLTPSIGTPLDAMDKAINNWKKCSKCAMSIFGVTSTPDYIIPVKSVCVSSGLAQSICQCDQIFASAVYDAPSASHVNTPASQCSSNGGRGSDLYCCNTLPGYSMYDANKFCCESGAVNASGTCVKDDGIKYQ